MVQLIPEFFLHPSLPVDMGGDREPGRSLSVISSCLRKELLCGLRSISSMPFMESPIAFKVPLVQAHRTTLEVMQAESTRCRDISP